MSVEINPIELGFHRPFNCEVAQVLKIRNPNKTSVAFKVKTTAPKQYCVRPNSGRIEPMKEVEVTVLLQAMKEQPPPNAKCRDKFLVQSVAVTGEKNGGDWQHVDDAEKSAVWEKKIRVTYLPPERNSKTAQAVTTPSKNGLSSSGYHGSDAVQTNHGSQRSPSPEMTYTPETRPGQYNSRNSVSAESKTSKSTLSYEEMQARLAKAEQTIANYSQEGGLRLRKKSKGDIDGEIVADVTHHVQQGSQGVPLKIVAALCFTSFLLAYLLF